MPEENEEVGEGVREPPTESADNEPQDEGTSEPRGEGEGEGPGEEVRERPGEGFVEGVRCSNCGSKVKAHETPSGTRYRCPECNSIVSVVQEGESPSPPSEPSTEETTPAPSVVREPPTPNEILNRVMKADPKLKGNTDVISWMMEQAELYGVLSTNEVKQLVRITNIQNADKTANRVAGSYASALQNEINRDPSLQNDSEWRNLIYKESGYRPQPQEQQTGVTPVPTQGQGQNPRINVPQVQGNPQNPQIGMTPVNQPQRMAPQQAPRQFNGGNGMTREEVREMVSGVLEERSKKTRLESVEENQRDLTKAIKGLKELVMNKEPKADRERGESLMDTIEEEAKKRVADRIFGEGEGSKNVSKDDVTAAVKDEMEDIRDDLGNRGELGKWDVEKAKADSGVDETELKMEARKEESRERRKAVEAVAQSIERLGENLGMGIGEGISRSSPGGTGSAPPGGTGNNPPGATRREPEPIVDDEGEPTGKFTLECPECGDDIEFTGGVSRVECESCDNEFRIRPER